MKIRKNGKVINLTESDLRRIVKRVISEQIIADKHLRGTPQEITDFIKNGGSIYNSSNTEITGDGESGYKFQGVESDGRVVLRWRKGDGLVLVIDPEIRDFNRTYEIYRKGGTNPDHFWDFKEDGVIDSWGSFMFYNKEISDKEKIKLDWDK